jgi:hypothetical protein
MKLSPNVWNIGDQARFGHGASAPTVRIIGFCHKGTAELVNVAAPHGEQWRSSFRNLHPPGNRRG